MAAAGCDAVFLGVESFDDETLSYLGKTAKPERYRALFFERVLPAIFETKMVCYVNLQVGVPFEGSAHRARTLAALAEAAELARVRGGRIVVCPMLHVIYPGTHLFQQGLAKGLFARDVFERFTAWEAEAEPVKQWLGRQFAHGTGGIPVGILRGSFDGSDGFEVDPRRVLEIENYLADVRDIGGLEVFDYEPYLVRDVSARRRT
jgi:hypothetical protein